MQDIHADHRVVVMASLRCFVVLVVGEYSRSLEASDLESNALSTGPHAPT